MPALTTTYCDVNDVKRYLQTIGINSMSTPTANEVKEMILDAEDEIDLKTNNSWKTKQVTNEYYDFVSMGIGEHTRNQYFPFGTGIPIHVRHRNIKSMDSSSGDKIEVWQGNGYTDYVATKTEGRGNDYWWDYTRGVLYIMSYPLLYYEKSIRLSYRYGTSVPKDIRKACALMVAIQFLLMDDRAATISETGDSTRIDYGSRISKYQAQINNILRNRFEIPVF